MAKSARRKRTTTTVAAGLAADASLGDVSRALAEGKVTASTLARAYLARIEAYDRGGPRLNAVREVNPDALSIAAAPRWRKTVGAPAAGRGADPGQGQHRHRRQAAHHRGFPRPGECARPGRCHGRQAAARGGGGDPGQGEPHGVRQHPHGRHARGLQLAGRAGEEPVCTIAGRRAGHSRRAAGWVERGLGRRRRGRPLRGGDRHRDLGLAAQSRDAERPGHREAHGRACQPCRHSADLAQPGHGRSAHAHRARRGDPAERAGGARSARCRDAAPAPAEGLHRGPRQGRPQGRPHRRAERSRRSAERRLPGQAAAQFPEGDDESA